MRVASVGGMASKLAAVAFMAVPQVGQGNSTAMVTPVGLCAGALGSPIAPSVGDVDRFGPEPLRVGAAPRQRSAVVMALALTGPHIFGVTGRVGVRHATNRRARRGRATIA